MSEWIDAPVRRKQSVEIFTSCDLVRETFFVVAELSCSDENRV